MKTSYFILLCLLTFVASKGLRFNSVEVTSLKNMNSLQKANFWVSSIINAFNDCKKFLTFSNSTTIVSYWKPYVYFNLDVKGKMEITEGIDGEYWADYKEKLKKFYSIPKEFYSYFDKLNFLEEFQDETAWQKCDLFYEIKKPEEEKYLRILHFMFTQNDFGDIDAVIICLDVKFDLASDFIVWRKSQTKFDNFWKKVEEVIIKKPESLEESDIKTIINMFELLSFKSIGRQLGIYLDYSDVEAILD